VGRTARLLAVPHDVEAPACFADFYAEFHPRVHRYALACFGPTYADEIAQEVMARSLAAFEVFDVERDPWPWFAVVTRNFGRTLVGRLQRCQLVQAQVFESVAADDWGDPVRSLEDAERQRQIAEALASLTVSQRRVLLLRLEEGLGFDVIGQLLGCSENAVRQQLHKARIAFSTTFEACGGRAHALVPIGALASLRRLFRRPDSHLAAAGASGLCAVVASVTIGVGLGLLPSPWGTDAAATITLPSRPAAAATTVHASADSMRTPEVAGGPVAPSVIHAVDPEPQVALAEGPARVDVNVGSSPFDQGEYATLHVSVATPAGVVRYEAKVRREAGLSVVCLSGAVTCR
jgi:RNA polymerase sigma factor (sigma-70 family)